MQNTYTVIEYDGCDYMVGKALNCDQPFIIDGKNFYKIFDKKFTLDNTTKYIRCTSIKNKLLHHFIKPYDGISIDHINQIKTDNREANLRYASQSVQNQNQSKKKRNVNLPESCKIDPNTISTFIWYKRVHENHGDRWSIEITNKYEWQTTSSKELSTECKYELAKQHLRNLIEKQPELLKEHCINGELQDDAKKLKQEYIDILKIAGYTYDEKKIVFDYLGENLTGLSEKEINVVKNGGIEYKHIDIYKDCDINSLPKYCYYVPETKEKGDGFCCGRLHPKHDKDWTTTKSRKVSTQEKLKQLMYYLKDEDYVPIQDVEIVKSPKKEKNLVTPEEKFALLSQEQLFEIINMKNDGKTTQDVSDYIKTHFGGLYIHRNFISKLWNNEVALSSDIKSRDVYQKMLVNTKQRTVKAKKFTADELLWLESNNLDKSLSERAKLFETKFKKSITNAYISKLNIKKIN